MDIDEIKKQLTKNMKEADADYTNYPENGEYPDGYASGCEYAIELLENLQEKKVVIPQFVADWITRTKLECDHEPIYMAEFIADSIDEGTDYHFDWLQDTKNQKLLLNAIANGYEVEKEPKYRVKLPGMIGDNGQQYISKSMDDKLFACAYRDYLEQEFTKEELEKFPNWVKQLEFEEVEDE